jgi:hypothetical protein
MRQRAFLALVVFTVGAAGCGGSKSTTTSSDGSGVDSAGVDDAGSDHDLGASSMDLSSTDARALDSDAGGIAGGSKVELASGNFVVLGLTSDGYVIYRDATATNFVENVYAVPAAGGSPVTITHGAQSPTVAIVGPMAFIYYPNTATVANQALTYQLSTWSHATGLKNTGAPAASYVAATVQPAIAPDASAIVYVTNAVPSGSTATGDIVVSKPDFTDPVTLATDVYVAGVATCPIQLAFTDAQTVIVGACVGSNFPSITKFSGAAWAGTTTSPLTYGTFIVDPTGAHLLAGATPMYSGVVSVDVATGKSTTLATLEGLPAFYIDNGATAVFTQVGTTSTSIAASPVATPNATTIAAGGKYPFNATPDGAHFLYATSKSTSIPVGAYDINLGSTTGGTPVALSATLSNVLVGDEFTADSKYVVWNANAVVKTSLAGISYTGTLTAQTLAGGAPITIGSAVAQVFAVGGAKLVFSENLSATTNKSDLAAVTLPGTAALIQSQIDPNMIVSPDRSRVFFTVSGAATAADDGLYSYAP